MYIYISNTDSELEQSSRRIISFPIKLVVKLNNLLLFKTTYLMIQASKIRVLEFH